MDSGCHSSHPRTPVHIRGSEAVQVYRRPRENIVWRILIDEGGLRSHRDGATLDLALRGSTSGSKG